MSLKPIRSYNDTQTINSQSKQDYVFMLDQFNLSDKQVLLIEIIERDSIRNQILKIKGLDLLKSKNIDSFKF